MSEAPTVAQAICDRLAAIDRASPVLDRMRVERSLAEHLRRLGPRPRPVRWVHDERDLERVATWRSPLASTWWEWVEDSRPPARPRTISELGSSELRSWRRWAAPEFAALASFSLMPERFAHPDFEWWWQLSNMFAPRAAMSAGQYDAGPLERANGVDRWIDHWIDIWLPFIEASEAGLWLFRFGQDEITALPRPALRVEEGRLHCADGPAVSWPDGAMRFFWHGVEVPEEAILGLVGLTPKKIARERDVRIRRIMIEHFGAGRYLRQSRRKKRVDSDEVGTLWRLNLRYDEPLVMVEVANATAEADGPTTRHFLRVPPTTRTAREAVAWTFAYDDPQEYLPEQQT